MRTHRHLMDLCCYRRKFLKHAMLCSKKSRSAKWQPSRRPFIASARSRTTESWCAIDAELPTERAGSIAMMWADTADICRYWQQGNIGHGACSSVRAVRCGCFSRYAEDRLCLQPKHR